MITNFKDFCFSLLLAACFVGISLSVQAAPAPADDVSTCENLKTQYNVLLECIKDQKPHYCNVQAQLQVLLDQCAVKCDPLSQQWIALLQAEIQRIEDLIALKANFAAQIVQQMTREGCGYNELQLALQIQSTVTEAVNCN